MKYSEAKQGRTFVVRLDPGEPLGETLMGLAERESIKVASLLILGALDGRSRLRVGTTESEDGKRRGMTRELVGERETTGTGTLVCDDKGKPTLHLHVACGRDGSTITGCAGKEVTVGYCLEVIVSELIDSGAVRAVDPDRGARLLVP